MWKLLKQRKRFALHTKVKYNTGRVKDGKVKTVSIAFSNIIHYGSSFYRRLDIFAEQGMGIQAKDCQIKVDVY